MNTSDNEDLSPWAHPKAQQWFEGLLERSHFFSGMEKALHTPLDRLDLGQCRLMLMFLILLGRNGIWPAKHQDLLKTAAEKFSQLGGTENDKRRRPLTLEQHQKRSQVAAEIQQELELLRRRVQLSKRKTKLGQPKTWRRFWD